MKDDDFNTYDDPADEARDSSDNVGEEATPSSRSRTNQKKDKRRELENLLEDKKLRHELKEYEDYSDSCGSYYEDDIFSEYYKKADQDNS